ncbi:MAG: 1-acyl-sn-glycerol-3-phosphate acyltransferase [Clostridiales bacterium]|nr:1-acyl-sn-glycerol-3-phosphate acyltransferase [Clostridiales bacterium]
MSEAQKKAPSKPKRSAVYAIGKVLATVLFKTFLPVKYHDVEKLNINPPCVMIANHTSFMDPVIIGVGVRTHQIRFIGKKELWSNKLVAALFNSMNMIPVDRHNSDMEAMRACMRVTREGNILGIFPEGTRHHKGLMEELESGVGLIALRSRVPLVPVYIAGKVGLFRTLHVYAGEPIPTADLLEQGVNKETCELLLKRITSTYAEMEKARTKA